MDPFLILQHVSHEGLGTLQTALENRALSFRQIRLYNGEKVPSTLNAVGGLILLGGPMNVYEEDDYPYLPEENRLVQEAIRKDMPILGICLGAQLMAKAAGARVYRGREKEIGWYPLELSPEARQDPLFSKLPPKMTVFQWHGDTFDLPSAGTRLAGSDRFANQAFRLGTKGYALQFHLEVTEEMIRDWIEKNQEELSALRTTIQTEKILQDSPRCLPDLRLRAEVFYDAFFSLSFKSG